MDIEERILDLNRIKIQLLVSWLSHQELILLINGCGQEIEDMILDNISASGRAMLLEGLHFSEEEFQKRKKARVALNSRYEELLKTKEEALKGSERRALYKKAYELLTEEEQLLYNSRFHEKIADLSTGFERELIGYLDKLEKGESLNKENGK